MSKSLSPLLACVVMASVVLPPAAEACTRAVYLGDGGRVATARSMDWEADLKTNLWVFPRGIARTGQTTQNPIQWTSKYGSVVAAVQDIITSDGMNEKGLVTNILWLTESKYPEATAARPNLSLAAWAQYVLDNFATVQEAVDALKSEPFAVLGGQFPGQNMSGNVHLALSDATGDSAILEYIDGKLVIHHGRSYQVMTNSPPYDQQLALNAYWEKVGGTAVLPGTSRASDRFARASYYIKNLPKAGDTRTVVAGAFSVIRNASVPMGVASPGEPNISPTLWRTVSDQNDLTYYFESARTPNTFWIDLKKMNLASGAPTLKLDLSNDKTYSGEVASQLKPAQPFKIR